MKQGVTPQQEDWMAKRSEATIQVVNNLLKERFKENDIKFQNIDERFDAQALAHFQMAETLKSIEKKLQEPTEEEKKKKDEEFDERIERAMKKAISGSGKWAYKALIVLAVIVGSFVTIGGGFKSLIGWLGFSKI